MEKQHCLLICCDKSEEAEKKYPDAIPLYWDSWKEVSIPQLLSKNLTRIRSEHAQAVYEMGFCTLQNKRLCDWLCVDNTLSMWWISLLYERHPKMTPNLYTIYRLRALELYLEEHSIQYLTVVGGDPKLCSVLSEFCKKTQRIFSKESSQKKVEKFSLRKLYNALPKLLQVSLRLIHWLIFVKRLLPRKKLPVSSNTTATIVTYFPNIDAEKAKEGRFYSRYFESLHTLLAKKPIRWVFIRFPSPTYTLSQCVRLKERFQEKQEDGFSFSYLEEFLNAGDIITGIRRLWMLAKKSRLIENDFAKQCHLPNSNINFWPYAAKDFIESTRGWRCLERILQYQAFSNFAKEAQKQTFTLFPLENCPWERMLEHIIHKNDLGPVLGFQHSSIRPTDFRYFDDPRIYTNPEIPTPDLLLANGQSALTQWQESGIPKEKLRMVEAVRYLYLANAKLNAKNTQKQTLLILTSFFHDETKAHTKLLLEVLAKGLFANYTILLKPHPYRALEQYIPKNILATLTTAQGSLAQNFRPNTLVWASNSTTAALEASYLGLPVAVMQPAHDFDLSPIQDIPDIFRTATFNDVVQMLEKAHPAQIPKDYLLLDPNLTQWKNIFDSYTLSVK